MANLTDMNWSQLVRDHGLEHKFENGEPVTLTSSDINKYRECRLMTKFDHKDTLPSIFKKYGVSILPITRSKFSIGPYMAYEKLPSQITSAPVRISLRDDLVTLPSSSEKITSEQTAISCAYTSSILAHFTGYPDLIPTLSGRLGSGDFSYDIESTRASSGMEMIRDIRVRGAQMEMDAVFETHDSIFLIEAKNHTCHDFIIRQLYYPYRYLRSFLGNQKRIIPIFMTYVDGIFSLYEYEFENALIYNSLKLVRASSYSTTDQMISTDDIDRLINVPCHAEPDQIFPQANEFSRIENIAQAILNHEQPLSIQDVIDLNMDFAPRQAKYYIDAGKYLGLYTLDSRMKLQLTSSGRGIFKMPYKKRKLALARQILSTPVFSRAYRLWVEQGASSLDTDSVQRIIMEYRSELNDTTAHRRAGTVKAWVKWITDLVE